MLVCHEDEGGMMENPYREPALTDKLPDKICLSSQELREIKAHFWDEGYIAGLQKGIDGFGTILGKTKVGIKEER